MPSEQKGFGAVGLIIIVTIGLIGFAGWFVWNCHNQTSKTIDNAAGNSSTVMATKESSPSINNSSNATIYDTTITARIENFESASTSLKATLVNNFYPKYNTSDECKTALADGWGNGKTVIYVRTMVRDDFAGVQFCGSGATSVLAHLEGGWETITSLGEAPLCDKVDTYKISKQITSSCYLPDGSSRTVTYE